VGKQKMNRTVPISDSYRQPIFDALKLQVIIGVLSLMILDGGQCGQICGAALLAFWGGAAVLIWRRPQTPTKTDLQLLRFGYLPIVIFAGVVIRFAWHLKGYE